MYTTQSITNKVAY